MRGNTVHRNLPAAGFVSLLLLLLLPCAASAVEIDDELKEILATKDTGIFPVLMIYHDPVTLDDLEAELNGLNPQKRRKRVVAELKKRGRKVQTNAAAILDSPLFEGQARNVRYLYLASAVSFDGTRGLVEALGGLEDNATPVLQPGIRLPDRHPAGGEPGRPQPGQGLGRCGRYRVEHPLDQTPTGSGTSWAWTGPAWWSVTSIPVWTWPIPIWPPTWPSTRARCPTTAWMTISTATWTMSSAGISATATRCPTTIRRWPVTAPTPRARWWVTASTAP